MNVVARVDELLGLAPLVDANVVDVPVDAEVHGIELCDGGRRVSLIGSDATPICALLMAGGTVRGPAIQLRDGAGLMTAYDAVARHLLARSQELATRSAEILRTLARADLQGSDIGTIVSLLASLVGNPVSLKDSDHRVLAWSGDPSVLDPARQHTVESGSVPAEILHLLEDEGILHRFRTESRPFRIETHSDVGLLPRVVCPVTSTGVQFGYLSISEGHRRLDALDFNAVDYGATVLAFHLSRDRAVFESIRSQKALLIYELLFNPARVSPTSHQQAAMLNVDLDQEFVVLVIVARPTEPDADTTRWTRTLKSMATTIDHALARSGLTSAVVLPEVDDLMVITPTNGIDLHKLAATLVRDLVTYHSVSVKSVGLSQPRRGSSGLKASYDEARMTAELAALKEPGGIAAYADLGALRLLIEIPSEAVEQHIAAVLGDDRRLRTEFHETFGALVASGYNKAAAARALYVHVNTLKYRMAKIRRETGHDPEDPDGQFALEFTFRLLELQRLRDQTR